MPGSSVQATIDALRTTLADLEHVGDSDGLIQLKCILLRRIAELEVLRNSGAAAKPVSDFR